MSNGFNSRLRRIDAMSNTNSLDAGALADQAQRALDLLRNGHLSQAESICQHIITSHPEYFHALHLLGIVALQRGDHANAAECLSAAVAADPAQPSAHSNLAAVLLALKRPAEALACCDRALDIRSDFPEALANRGDALFALRRYQEALSSFERATSLAPSLFAAHFGRANTLVELQSEEEALRSYDRALQISPRHACALANRGNALLRLKLPEQALAAFDAALRASPELAEALNGRGCALRTLRRFPEAIDSFERALLSQPRWAAALYNEAKAWLELGRFAEAIDCCDRALSSKPDLADALNIKANALRSLNRFEDAASVYMQVLSLQPNFDYALGNHVYSRANACDWRSWAEYESAVLESIGAGKRSCLPFCFLSVSDSAAAQLQCARLYTADHRTATAPLWRGKRYRHGRIRLAYVSGDFGEHAVSYLLAGLFERHDAERFETFAVSLRPEQPTPMGQRIRRAFNAFIDVSGRSDREVAEMMRQLEIDIAVDLAGFTSGMRAGIFAHRPAPIQVNYLGFPATMGAEYMDYIIADDFVIPPDCAKLYGEQVAYLPECFQGNDDRRPIPDRMPARAAEGLTEEAFVFCSFNNSYKINPRLFEIWMRLLRRTPGSVLWLLGGSGTMRANLLREAESRGVEARQLVFADRRGYEEHLARFALADLFLDSLPFNAGATASDALWAGVPVLTSAGEAFAARMAGSLLRAIGLPELITHSLEEYEARALQLAHRPAELRDLRERLLGNRYRSPLFDTDRFRRALESAYEQMWQRHQRGLPPQMVRAGI